MYLWNVRVLGKTRDFENNPGFVQMGGKILDFEKPRDLSKVHVLKRGGAGPSPHCLLTCFSG